MFATIEEAITFLESLGATSTASVGGIIGSLGTDIQSVISAGGSIIKLIPAIQPILDTIKKAVSAFEMLTSAKPADWQFYEKRFPSNPWSADYKMGSDSQEG